MRVALAVDVARGQGGVLEVARPERERAAVVAHGPQPFHPAAGVLVQDEDLPLGLAAAAFDHGLAVELDEGLGLLDEPVGFGCGHVVVGGDADEDRLAAAPLGQEELAGREVGVHRDGVGALEVADGQPEGLGDVDPFPEVVFDLQRDDLGVGRDLGVNAPAGALEHLAQLLEVVDVPVQAGVDHPAFAGGAVDDAVVDGVAVRLGDGADRCPACVRVDGVEFERPADRAVQDGVRGNFAAQESDVVPQAADLAGDLVGEGERHPPGVAPHADAPVQEGFGGRARGEFRREPLLGQLRAQAVEVGRGEHEQDRHPGRVAAAHLHAVDAVEHRVQVAEHPDDLRPGGTPRTCQQRVHLAYVVQQLRRQRPDDVPQAFDPAGDAVGLGRRQAPDLFFQLARFRGGRRAERLGQPLEPVLQVQVGEHGAERLVAFQSLHGLPERLHDLVAAAAGNARVLHPLAQPLDVRERGGRGGDGRAFERHDSGDAAAETGAPQREEHQAAGRDAREAAAEVHRGQRPASQPGGAGVQAGDDERYKRSQQGSHVILLGEKWRNGPGSQAGSSNAENVPEKWVRPYFSGVPGATGRSGITSAEPVASPAASSMPWDMTPMSLAGLRLATTMI